MYCCIVGGLYGIEGGHKGVQKANKITHRFFFWMSRGSEVSVGQQARDVNQV